MSYMEEMQNSKYKTVSSWVVILFAFIAGLMFLATIVIVILGFATRNLVSFPQDEAKETMATVVYQPKSLQNEYLTFYGEDMTITPTKENDELLILATQFIDSYVIPESNSTLLLYDNLILTYTYGDLYFAYYEIFARHNVIFNEEVLDGYFQGKSWYTGKVSVEEFTNDDSLIFNDYEIANKQVIYDAFCYLYQMANEEVAE